LIEPAEGAYLAIMSEKELEQIKTDLRGLLEANQPDWLQLATQE
jgi:hypothetical protein